MDSQRQESRRKLSKVKQACDCCHTRKIRCDGEDPCANCQATELRCTYLTVPKKKGPKGPRIGKPLSTYRRRKEHIIYENTALRREYMIYEHSTPRIPPPIVPQTVEQHHLHIDDGIDGEFGFQMSPLISPDIIRRCVDGFFAHKYPIMPIIDREQTYASLDSLQEHPEQYGLMTALCALIILQPEILGPPGSSENSTAADNLPSPELFITETRRSRQFCNYIENPTLATVQTSFLLFAALFPMGRDNSAWFYIREAMTMLQLQRFHEEDTYSSMTDLQHAKYTRRTFWVLFVTERAYALQRHRPLTLQRTIDLPTVSPGPEATILSGFLDLVSLFQNFDGTFLSFWNLSPENHTTSPQSIVRLQDILKFALPDVSDRMEIQQADLLVSRQWLKTMVWQLCVTKGLLSSSTTNESMSFQYPVTIARDMVLVSQLLPPTAFEANGVGILEKVFDIGCSLADVLLLHPSSIEVSSLKIGPRDYLMELMRILGTVLGGSSRYLQLLAAKADECLQMDIRGSLSDSDSSNEMTVIEEINDDDENYNNEGNKVILYGPSTAEGVQDLEAVVQFQFPDQNFGINGLSPTNFENEAHHMAFSLSTPDWNRILEADSVF